MILRRLATTVCVRTLAAVVSLCPVASELETVDGVTNSSIVLGQAAALKGAAEALGQGMQAGLNASFHRANAAGGVNGRRIELKSVNDGYEPERSAVATQLLIDNTGVFAMIGAVGTPTSKVTLPLCIDRKVPFVAPFTGAQVLRSPHSAYAVHLRASYDQETEALAGHLVKDTELTRIACLFQNDAFGQAGLNGIRSALDRRGMRLVAEASFERNSVAVKDALSTIAAAKPDAIVMLGPYRPCAEFVRVARQHDATRASTFATISFVGSEALGRELGSEGDGLVISQVVPSPSDTTLSVVRDYLADMQATGAEAHIGYVSLEGYLAGKLFCAALAKVEGEPNRELFLHALTHAGTIDLGGFTVTFGEDDNEGSDAVFLTVLRNGKAIPVSGAATATGAER
jgi:branched-chain amino acid transport system substrate-binding protein